MEQEAIAGQPLNVRARYINPLHQNSKIYLTLLSEPTAQIPEFRQDLGFMETITRAELEETAHFYIENFAVWRNPALEGIPLSISLQIDCLPTWEPRS